MLEHPELAQQPRLSAATSDDLRRADRGTALAPRIENNRQCDLHHHRIQFASSQAADKAGIGVDAVGRRRMIEAIVANGEITYDQTRAAHLSTKAPGMVWRVEKQVGEPVAKGDVLALVDAAEVGKAKSDFLQALVQSRLNRRTSSGSARCFPAVRCPSVCIARRKPQPRNRKFGSSVRSRRWSTWGFL